MKNYQRMVLCALITVFSFSVGALTKDPPVKPKSHKFGENIAVPSLVIPYKTVKDKDGKDIDLNL